MALQLDIAKNYNALSRTAASLLDTQIRWKPSSLFCIATGSTPTGTYKELVKLYREDKAAYAALRTIKLDEWGGLPMTHPATCESYVRKYVNGPLGITASRYISFKSRSKHPATECRRIERELHTAGPIDICILGMGANGHLGFNEPAGYLHAEPHVAKLTETSLTHSMVKEVDNSQLYGVTLGMQAIMESKKVLMLINGKHKAEHLKRLMTRHISNDFPASMLWLHRNCLVLADREAAALL